MKVRGIDHIHLLVPDLGRAVSVVETLVGGAGSEPYGGEEWNAWASYHQLGGFDIFQPIDMEQPMFGYVKEEVGAYIMAFRVDDIDDAVEDVNDLGLSVVSRIGSEEAGFGRQMLQAQLERYFGIQMELVERGLPDDPLHCPIPDYLDHIDVFVRDIAQAMSFYTMLTGHGFPEPTPDERLGAVSSTNDLGVRLTAPTSPDSPVGQRLDKLGEGVAAIGLISSDLERSMASAEVLDLSFVSRYTGESFCAAEFDAADVFGFSLRLVERVS